MASTIHHDGKIGMATDVELARSLLWQWHATRAWAESLLCQILGIGNARDSLAMRVQGRGLPQAIPGSNWTYQLHGVGVRFDRGFGVGGIDFDFDKPIPDFFRFRDFAECQFNAGNLPAEWRDLIEDESRLERAFAAAIAETITPS